MQPGSGNSIALVPVMDDQFTIDVKVFNVSVAHFKDTTVAPLTQYFYRVHAAERDAKPNPSTATAKNFFGALDRDLPRTSRARRPRIAEKFANPGAEVGHCTPKYRLGAIHKLK